MLQQKDDSASSNPSWNTKIFFFSDWPNFWYTYAFNHGESENKSSFCLKKVYSRLDSNLWPKDCCAAFPALGRRRIFLTAQFCAIFKNTVRCRKKFWIECIWSRSPPRTAVVLRFLKNVKKCGFLSFSLIFCGKVISKSWIFGISVKFYI